MLSIILKKADVTVRAQFYNAVILRLIVDEVQGLKDEMPYRLSADNNDQYLLHVSSKLQPLHLSKR